MDVLLEHLGTKQPIARQEFRGVSSLALSGVAMLEILNHGEYDEDRKGSMVAF